MGRKSLPCDKCPGNGWFGSFGRCHRCGGKGQLTRSRILRLRDDYYPSKVSDEGFTQAAADAEIAILNDMLRQLDEGDDALEEKF